MANPYPPQMQPGMQPMQPMQSGPGMPPGMMPGGGGIPMAGSVRKGTPKAVPVVVSAGLAVGVFCGLYFGLGTGEPTEATAGPSKASAATGPQTAAAASNEVANFKSGDAPLKPSGGSGSDAGSGSAGSAAVAAGSGSDAGSGSAAVAAGSGSGSGAGSGSGSAAVAAGSGSAAADGPLMLEVTFLPTPENATITVDGKPLTANKTTIEITGEKTDVRVVAKASGYKTFDKKMTFTRDWDLEDIKIPLVKRSGGSSGGNRDRDRDRDRDPPGGLIDL
jgi:hypothetical protein